MIILLHPRAVRPKNRRFPLAILSIAAVLASLVLALPCHAVELPARCNDAYLAAMLSGVGQRCPSYHFHLTEAGKRRMYALMRASGGSECMDLALAKIAVDLSYSEKKRSRG